jgi:uncharacterized membrane protein
VRPLATVPGMLRESSGIPGWMLVVATVLSVAVAIVSFRYLVMAGPIPPAIAANAQRDPWLLIHVAGAATALLVGSAQFFPRLRARHLSLHRWVGRVYVLGCAVGGVSGLVLALGASTGGVTSTGFGALAFAWLVTTALAWRRAVQRRVGEHQAWMIRSFSLTLAAVTLRIYLPIGELLPVPFAIAYQVISFLCWVPNLLAAEIYLRRRKAHRTAER